MSGAGRVLLQSRALTFELGATTRDAVEAQFGVAFSYPMRGWHTYAALENGSVCLLSAFYSGGRLIAAELYVPRAAAVPPIDPVDFGGFTLEPGGIRIGMQSERTLQARFEGGVAYAMVREGRVDRLALYGSASA